MNTSSFATEEGPIEAFLRSHGAGGIPHPGGMLLDHLRRVASRLAEWGAGQPLWSAGYCHASYGTDGFDVSLIDLSGRSLLEGIIGPAAEQLVYTYASCDRSAVYPLLDGKQVAAFRDRFTGETSSLSGKELRAFWELTVANELDVLAHNNDMALQYGPYLRRLFQRARPLLSLGATQAIDLSLIHI